MQRESAHAINDGLLHCPHCHLSIPAGVMECGFCGRALSGPDSVVVRPRNTWIERMYLVCSVLLIIQGLLWGVIYFLPEARGVALFYGVTGLAGVLLGIALLRLDPLAQSLCRFMGLPVSLVFWIPLVVSSHRMSQPEAWFTILIGCPTIFFWAIFSVVLWKLRD